VAAAAVLVMLVVSSCEIIKPTEPGRNGVTYGPFTIGGGEMLANRFIFNADKACTDCLITGMKAKLIGEDGAEVNIDQGLWLHHMVLGTYNRKTDLTCAGTPLSTFVFGERFFASGNERTPIVAGSVGKFGYPVNAGDSWTLDYDLMNESTVSRNVRVVVDFDYVPLKEPGYKPIRPLWLDVNQCGTSEVPAKTGKYSYTYTWNATIAGKLLGIGGHLHDSGVDMDIYLNDVLICKSVAHYGETPAYIGLMGETHISSISTCYGSESNPVAHFNVGDRIKISANYDADSWTGMHDHGGSAHSTNVMGIANGVVLPD